MSYLNIVKNLNDQFPGREFQIKLLCNLLCVDDDECLSQSIFLHGPRATGKTAILKKLLCLCKYSYIFIDCYECYTQRLLLNIIIRKLFFGENDEKYDNIDPEIKNVEFCNNIDAKRKNEEFCKNVDPESETEEIFINIDSESEIEESCNIDPKDENDEFYDKAASFLDLVNFFKINNQYLKVNKNLVTNFHFIILKNCEELRPLSVQTLLHLPGALSEKLKLCIIFVSQNTLIYEYNLGSRIPRIAFPRYGKDQLQRILLLRQKNHRGLFLNFLRLFLNSVYHYYRDLREIINLVDVLFDIYKKPVEESKINSDDYIELCKNIAPYLKANIYKSICLGSSSLSLVNDIKKTNNFKLTNRLDLPLHSKYLLIAAYLASFIPPKNDAKLFCKQSLKKKKRKNVNFTHRNKSLSLHGAKAFPLNRLLAIFASISEEPTNVSFRLLSQVSTLVELKLLASFNKAGEENIDNLQYKCIANSDCVHSIAKSLEINLEKYLNYN